MEFQIKGEVMQALEITLYEGEEVYSESGSMSYMSSNMEMQSVVHGGLGGGISRIFTGESLFTVKFKTKGKTGQVTFTPSFQGKIVPIQIGDGKEIICQKDSFLVAENTVSMQTAFRKKLAVGLFGGEGFILQKLSGSGMAFLEVDGEVIEKTLEKGEEIYVDTGSIAFFENSVEYDIRLIRGIRNVMFGGEGMFLAVLKGPGKVWLQTMHIQNIASRLLPFMKTK